MSDNLTLPLAADATEMLPSINASVNTVMTSFLIQFPPFNKVSSKGIRLKKFYSNHLPCRNRNFSCNTCNTCYNKIEEKRRKVVTFREADKMIRDAGWKLESVEGSHHHYKHTKKPGKVTIPHHNGDIPKRVVNSIKKQAGIK
jgi:predicted RNA binding protein YcfA (HicA-like mRNA interferase family)